jgi:ribosome-associated protein
MKPSSTRTRKRTAPRKISSELTAAIAAALDKKAEDILVLDLTKASAFTDFFVICTGGNRRQIQAIDDAIVDAVGARGAEPALVEG